VSTVAEIRDAIHKLPPNEAWQLAAELRDYLDALWDTHFEQHVTAGRLDELIGRAREQHARGKTAFPARPPLSCRPKWRHLYQPLNREAEGH
jgi:hypothetical protein